VMAMNLVLIFLALLASPMSVRADHAFLRFSRPDGPDRAEVEFFSRGCFHDTKSAITLFRNPPSAQVQDAGGSGSLALSSEDLASLDTLFDFYRLQPGGFCTTFDAVIVTWFRGNEKLAREHFGDASCLTDRPRDGLAADLFPSEGYWPPYRAAAADITLTLQELIRRARGDVPLKNAEVVDEVLRVELEQIELAIQAQGYYVIPGGGE